MHKRTAFILLLIIAIIISLVTLITTFSSLPQISKSLTTVKSDISDLDFTNTSSNKPSNKLQLPQTKKSNKEAVQADENLPDDYIKECNNASFDKKQKQLNEKLKNYLTVIEHSDIHDDKLSYLLLNTSKGNTKTSERLKKLFELMPTSPTIIKSILAECLRKTDNSLCNNAIYEQAEAEAGNYASVLMQLAALRYQQEDFSKSKQLLTKVINRSSYNEPPYEFKTLIDNNLLLHGSFTDLERLLLTAFKNPPSLHFTIVELCKSAITEDKEYVDLCLSVGKLLEQTADTYINNITGILLQINVYKEISEPNSVSRLREAFKEKNAFFQSQEFNKAMMLAYHDEDLLRDWLFMKEKGTEKLAAEALIKYAKLLSKNPDYSPCPIEQN